MTDKLWIEVDGEAVLVSYDDLDPEVMGVFARPTGAFSYAAQNFMRLTLPKVPFYIDDWLPVQGKALIYGPRKSGKSFLALQTARCIGEGEPLLGIPTKQGRVLYIQGELGPNVLLDRMITTKQEYENVFVGTTFSMMLDKAEGQQMLMQELEIIRPQVLIIDPLYKFMSGDENEQRDVMIVLNFLDNVLDMYSDCKMSVLIMHHPGKDLSRGARGSSVLEGWVDAAIEMKRTSSDTDPILKAKLTPKALRHAPLNGGTAIVLGDDGEFHAGEAQQSVLERVMEYMKENAPCKMQELIDAGVGSRKSVYDARKILSDLGTIRDIGGGEYEWIG